MPDDHFPDLMHEVGVDNTDRVTAYLAAVTAIAGSATAEQAARLVEVAHEHVVDRNADEWFWRPFRDADAAFFPVEDGVPIHSRLADACVRHRLADGSLLDAMLVRLAALDGWHPATDLLHEAARVALVAEAGHPKSPAAGPPRKTWTASDAEKVDAVEAINVEALKTLGDIVGAAADRSLNSLRTRVGEVVEWAESVQHSLQRELDVTHWLITGLRADGKPWATLDIATVAVDAAAELAERLEGDPPEPRHEALLCLALRAAHDDADSAVCSGPTTHATQLPAVPDALAPFTPIHVALRASADLPGGSTALTVAVRVLWEASTATAWPEP